MDAKRNPNPPRKWALTRAFFPIQKSNGLSSSDAINIPSILFPLLASLPFVPFVPPPRFLKMIVILPPRAHCFFPALSSNQGRSAFSYGYDRVCRENCWTVYPSSTCSRGPLAGAHWTGVFSIHRKQYIRFPTASHNKIEKQEKKKKLLTYGMYTCECIRGFVWKEDFPFPFAPMGLDSMGKSIRTNKQKKTASGSVY